MTSAKTMSLQMRLEQQQQFVFERDVYQALLKQSVFSLNEALTHFHNDGLDNSLSCSVRVLVVLGYMVNVFVCPSIVESLHVLIRSLHPVLSLNLQRRVIEQTIDLLQFYIN